jgi:hypothetical protein
MWTIRVFVPEFSEFLFQSAFANLSIIPARFGNAILENLNFGVYGCEWVCVRLICHDMFHPLVGFYSVVHLAV